MNLNGKNVVIYGAGISGMSAYGLVKEHGGRAVIYDDKAGVAHSTNNPSVFNDADVIVLSPGVSCVKDFLLDAKLQNKIVVSELELASEFCNAEQIAITGTNGKTTTTMLIDHIFKCAHKSSHAVGNIGAAFSAVADKLDAMEIAVIEASSFQLESALNFAPDIAVILNITPDHLERHGNMKRYVAAKANVFLKQSECDKVVYNADDEYIEKLIPHMAAEQIPFSVSRPVIGAYVSSGFICFKGAPIVEISDIDFKGRELENVLAAVAVTMSHGISAYTVAAAVTSFERPDFRRKEVAKIDGIKIYNDSKATNVYSTLSAIEGTSGNTVLILGGAKRQEDFTVLFKFIDAKVLQIVAVGENAALIRDTATASGYGNVSIAKNLEEAVALGLEFAKSFACENLLFSPSSKSFDGYDNYVERGKSFDAAVRNYIKK